MVNLNLDGAGNKLVLSKSLVLKAGTLLRNRDCENLACGNSLLKFECKAHFWFLVQKVVNLVRVVESGGVRVDTNTCGGEVANVIFVGDEEDSVVLNRRAKFCAEIVSPEGGVVGPGTSPFLLAPGVAKLEELVVLTFMLKLVN